jgi:hypothetical protein
MMSVTPLPVELVLDIVQRAGLNPIKLWLLSQASPTCHSPLADAASDNTVWRVHSPQSAIDNAKQVPLVHAFAHRLAAKTHPTKLLLAGLYQVAESARQPQHIFDGLYHHANDFDVMLAANHVTGHFYGMVGPSLCQERTLALVAFAGHGAQYLHHASAALRDEAEVVRTAVSHWGKALSYASDRLRQDPTTVQLAYRQDVCAYTYASETLRYDPDFVYTLFRIKPSAYLFQFMPDDFRQDSRILNVFNEHFDRFLMEESEYLPTKSELNQLFNGNNALSEFWLRRL